MGKNRCQLVGEEREDVERCPSWLFQRMAQLETAPLTSCGCHVFGQLRRAMRTAWQPDGRHRQREKEGAMRHKDLAVFTKLGAHWSPACCCFMLTPRHNPAPHPTPPASARVASHVGRSTNDAPSAHCLPQCSPLSTALPYAATTASCDHIGSNPGVSVSCTQGLAAHDNQ